MRGIFAALTGTLLLAACAGTLGRNDAHETPWIELKTANFAVWTPLQEKKARKVSRDLERFRSIAEFVIGRRLPDARVPTRVYVFDDIDNYSDFGPRGTAGYFFSTMRDNSMVNGGQRREIMQHEYVHFLLDSHGTHVYPSWYHEGFATFLGATQVRGASVEIGRSGMLGVPRFERGSGYRVWADLDVLMSALVGPKRERKDRTFWQFYQQSWALVHYLYLGRTGMGDSAKRLGRYFRLTQQGASVPDAVRKSFGMSIESLDRAFRAYAELGHYKYVTVPVADFGETQEPQVSPLKASQVAVVLGQLSAHMERWGQAEAYFEKAAVLDPQDPAPLYGLAGVLLERERFDEADEKLRVALGLAPEDATTHLEVANRLHARAREEADATNRDQLAREARKHYVMSWKLDSSIVETYAEYGSTYLLDGQDAKKGLKTLLHAHELLPTHHEVLIRLARLRFALDEKQEARRLALAAYVSLHDDDTDDAIVELLEQTGGQP